MMNRQVQKITKLIAPIDVPATPIISEYFAIASMIVILPSPNRRTLHMSYNGNYDDGTSEAIDHRHF